MADVYHCIDCSRQFCVQNNRFDPVGDLGSKVFLTYNTDKTSPGRMLLAKYENYLKQNLEKKRAKMVVYGHIWALDDSGDTSVPKTEKMSDDDMHVRNVWEDTPELERKEYPYLYAYIQSLEGLAIRTLSPEQRAPWWKKLKNKITGKS